GKPPGNAGQVVERQPDVALALVVFIIDSDHNAVMRIFPGPGQEGIPGLIAAPGGGASQLSPRAVTEDRSLQQADELVVEGADFFVDMFFRGADKVRGNLDAPSLQLAVVKEAKPWRQVGDDRGRPVHGRGEGGCGTWFIVIFKEPDQLVLE